MQPTRTRIVPCLAVPPAVDRRRQPVFSAQDRANDEPAGKAASVLIVEDDFLAASEIEAVLTEEGYEIAGIANRAQEAVRLAKAKAPDLIVMDIRLIGEIDGVDAALEIFRQTGIRCIFATAHQDATMRARADPAAPLGWLRKPYAPHALLAVVEQALAER
jgi:DNA-binding NarL/FixJ family response regulator